MLEAFLDGVLPMLSGAYAIPAIRARIHAAPLDPDTRSVLKKAGLVHSVLNAKYHQQEAEIVSHQLMLRAGLVRQSAAGISGMILWRM